MSDESKVKITPGTRARCAWEVNAGVLPGTPIPGHTRRWFITSECWEKDNAMTNEEFAKVHPDGRSTFRQYCEEVYDYARKLNDPRYLNWVKVEWIWY